MRMRSGASAAGPGFSVPGFISFGDPGSSRTGIERCDALFFGASLMWSSNRTMPISPKYRLPPLVHARLTFSRRTTRPASSPFDRSSADT